jgi:dsDNA-specific endonuclease/ATPase MutS2
VFALHASLDKKWIATGAKSRALFVNSEGGMTGPVEIPIEDSIDLHTFQPREIPDLVEEYLYQAILKGYREVRIIHGRGIGVQRRIVHSILEKHPQVISFHDSADRGSTTVILNTGSAGVPPATVSQ